MPALSPPRRPERLVDPTVPPPPSPGIDAHSLRGIDIAVTSPAEGNVLTVVDGKWAPAPPPGGAPAARVDASEGLGPSRQMVFVNSAGGDVGLGLPAVTMGREFRFLHLPGSAHVCTLTLTGSDLFLLLDGSTPSSMTLAGLVPRSFTGLVSGEAHNFWSEIEPTLATTTPLAESGAGAVGTSGNAARADHVHPAAGGGGASRPDLSGAPYAWELGSALFGGQWVNDGSKGAGSGAYNITPGAAVIAGAVPSQSGVLPLLPGLHAAYGAADNTALALTGSLAAPTDLTRATFEVVWRELAETGGDETIAWLYSPTDDAALWELNYSNYLYARVRYGTGGSGFQRVLNPSVTLGTDVPSKSGRTHFAAIRYTGTQMELWLDGLNIAWRNVAADGLSADTPIYWPSDLRLAVGGKPGTSGRHHVCGVRWVYHHAAALSDALMRSRAAQALGWPAP